MQPGMAEHRQYLVVIPDGQTPLPPGEPPPWSRRTAASSPARLHAWCHSNGYMPIRGGTRTKKGVEDVAGTESGFVRDLLQAANAYPRWATAVGSSVHLRRSLSCLLGAGHGGVAEPPTQHA